MNSNKKQTLDIFFKPMGTDPENGVSQEFLKKYNITKVKVFTSSCDEKLGNDEL